MLEVTGDHNVVVYCDGVTIGSPADASHGRGTYLRGGFDVVVHFRLDDVTARRLISEIAADKYASARYEVPAGDILSIDRGARVIR